MTSRNMHDSTESLFELDSIINAMESQLASLKERRNHLASSFTGVPDELIVKMFCHLRHVNIQEDQHGVLNWWPWIQQLALCRRTWNIAITTPELWTVLPVGFGDLNHSAAQLSLCMKRSGEFPLTLQLHLHPAREILDLIIRSGLLARVSELRIPDSSSRHVDPTPDEHKTLSGWFYENKGINKDEYVLLFQQGWHSLQRADLNNYYAGTRGNIDTGFLHHASSTLTVLHLSSSPDYHEWWIDEAPRLFALQELRVRSITSNRHRQLIQWLSSMPRLVSLHLELALHWGPDRDDPAIYLLKLSSLRYVSLVGTANEVLYILLHLPYPKDELSIHSLLPPLKDHHTAALEAQSQLIHYSIKFWDVNINSAAYHSHYKIEMATHEDSLYGTLTPWSFSILPNSDSDQTYPSTRLNFRGANAEMTDFVALASRASDVVCTGIELFDKVIDTILQAPFTVDHISLLLRTRDMTSWQTKSTLDRLDKILKLRKASSCSELKTLTVNEIGPRLESLQSIWKTEGLVECVLEERETYGIMEFRTYQQW